MEETTNNVFSSMMASIGATIAGFYAHLAPWLLLGMVLVLTDLRYGILAAKTRGETIRTSRAMRRTINKMVDYLCWVTVVEVCSRTFGVTIGVPVVSLAVLFIIYGIELSSCVNNYLEYKGTKKRFNFFKLIGKEELLEDKPDGTVEEVEERELIETEINVNKNDYGKD